MSQQRAIDTFFVARKRRFCGDDIAAVKKRLCLDTTPGAKSKLPSAASAATAAVTTKSQSVVRQSNETRSRPEQKPREADRRSARSKPANSQRSLDTLAGWKSSSADDSGHPPRSIKSVVSQQQQPRQSFGDSAPKVSAESGKTDSSGGASDRNLLESGQVDGSAAAGAAGGGVLSAPPPAAAVSENVAASGFGVGSSQRNCSVSGVQRRLFDDDDDGKDAKQQLQEDCSSNSSSGGGGGGGSAAVHSKPSVVPVGGATLMSPQKMRASLRGCNKIQQLRDRLAQFNRASDRLRTFNQRQSADSPGPSTSSGSGSSQAPPGLLSPTAIEFELTSPQKTPRKMALLSPVKSPSVRQCLLLMDSAPHSLTLPFKYRQLKEMFHCVDTCVSFLHNRKEIITMRKLRPSVQQMLGRAFREHHLAQICTVFPAAYHLCRERNIPNHTNTPNSKHLWQLVLRPNMDYDSAAAPSSCEKFRQLTPQRLLHRGHIFAAALLDLVRQQHADFLATLDPPLAPPSVDQLKRWHAEFPLEEVCDVAPAQLPAPPDSDQQLMSAEAVLQRAARLLAPYPHLTSCLQQVAEARAAAAAGGGGEDKVGGDQDAPAAAATSNQPSPADDSNRGLPSGLLARIRAREAARASLDMTRTPAAEARRGALSQLPTLTRALRAIFVTERRGALPQQLVVHRLLTSSALPLEASGGAAGTEQLVRQLQLLAEEAPQLLQCVTLKSGSYVKLDRQCDVNAVIAHLEQRYKEL